MKKQIILTSILILSFGGLIYCANKVSKEGILASMYSMNPFGKKASKKELKQELSANEEQLHEMEEQLIKLKKECTRASLRIVDSYKQQIKDIIQELKTLQLNSEEIENLPIKELVKKIRKDQKTEYSKALKILSDVETQSNSCLTELAQKDKAYKRLK